MEKWDGEKTLTLALAYQGNMQYIDLFWASWVCNCEKLSSKREGLSCWLLWMKGWEVKEALIFFISNHCILSYSIARLKWYFEADFIESYVARWLWRQGVNPEAYKIKVRPDMREPHYYLAYVYCPEENIPGLLVLFAMYSVRTVRDITDRVA